MENAELEVALEELESRLERLRALYEQYFMGIERIEPQIPRKDVDRRIYVLRREKIRNTAKRFKLQTIISRYNTFQQYWQRICREIEQGTYKRHLIKAERIAPGKMMTIAARKRLGKAALEAMEEGVAPDAPAHSSAPPSEGPASAPLALPSPLPPLEPSAALGTSRLAPPPKPVPPPKPGARPPKPGSVAPALAASEPAPPANPPAPLATGTPRPAFESLDLDMDFLGDWDPSAAAKPAGKRAPQVPTRPFGKSLSRPLSTPPAAPEPRKPAPPPKPAAPGLPLSPLRSAPLASAVRASSVPPKPVSVAPRPEASPARPPLPARPAPPPHAARPLAAPIPGASSPRVALATPAASANAANARASAPTPPAKPMAPVAAPPVAAGPPKPVPPKPAPLKPAALAQPAVSAPDERVRELHARLVEAKRQTQDATAVSMEGLARSMKATEAKLREQHKNRKIDFDVVIKDGKAVLKPIVR